MRAWARGKRREEKLKNREGGAMEKNITGEAGGQ